MMNDLPDRKTAVRMFRGLTLSHIAVFILALGMLMTAVAVASSQWQEMEGRIAFQSERIAKLEAIASTNDQRIQNQHIRLSSLEKYNADMFKRLEEIAINTKQMTDLLRQHVSPRVTSEGSIEIAPPKAQ